jgi:flavodoxin I
MKQIAIIYGSSTGNTKEIAATIARKLAGNVTLLDADKLKAGDLEAYPNLILGTSTWGYGDLQDDWESKLSILKNSDLQGKTIAFFGLGDASSYPDTFVNGMGILHAAVKDRGAMLIGRVPVEGYSFDASEAVDENDFVGVALDEDNESDRTESRLNEWIARIQPEFV